MAGREFKTQKKPAWNRKKDVLTSEESAQGKRDSRKRKQQAYRFQRASDLDQKEASDKEQTQKNLMFLIAFQEQIKRSGTKKNIRKPVRRK